MELTTFIYGLWDPRDGRLRYIGKSNKPKERLTNHLRAARKKGATTHLRCWLIGLMDEGEKPLLEVLEEVSRDSWQEVERDWIRQCKEHGIDLVNLCSGGLGGAHKGHETSESTRQKMRDYWADPEWRAKTLQARKEGVEKAKKKRDGRFRTPEGLAAFKEKRKTWSPGKGKKHTTEHNAKIGAANAVALKGYQVPKEVREMGNKTRWSKPGEHERWSELTKQRPRRPDGTFLPKDES